MQGAITFTIFKKANSNKNSVKITLETISYGTSQSWDLVAAKNEQRFSLSMLKEKIKA